MIDWQVCVIFFIQGIFCKSIQLTPTQANADVNENFTFTCTYFGYDDVTWTKWNLGKMAPTIVRKDGRCTGDGLFADDTMYSVGCPSKTSFTVTILRVQLEDHNDEWSCYNFYGESNTVTIFVKVPVSDVILSVSKSVSSFMREHSRQTIKCKTSIARPQPIISWYVQESTNSKKHKVAVNSSTQIIPSNNNGLVAVENTLWFYPNRSLNSWMLYCEGWTDNENRSVQSNTLTMNITYPPKSPPKIVGFEHGEKYTLIESDVGKLSCYVHGGNPLPRLTWYCYNNTQTPDVIEGETVTKNVTWIGSREQTSCSCISIHPWPRITQSTNISIDVLFPTKIGTFSLSSKRSELTVVINETDEASLECIAEANPFSNLSIENPRGDTISEVSNSNIVHHTLRNVSCVNAGEYTCTGKNIYTRGLPARSHLILIVKCPPMPSSGDTNVVNVATSMGVDKTLTFSAIKYLDDPKKTVFRWFKGNQHISENGFKYIISSEELQTSLSIRNTTQQDLGLYRVFVRNSVGKYVHYYVLNEAVTTNRPLETICSTHTGAFVGVGAGTFLFTLVLVTCLFIGYKQLKRHRFTRRKSYKQKVDKTKPHSPEESQATSAYTDLDGNKTEVNEYDAINVQNLSSEQKDMPTQGSSAYIEMKNARDLTMETIDYININK